MLTGLSFINNTDDSNRTQYLYEIELRLVYVTTRSSSLTPLPPAPLTHPPPDIWQCDVPSDDPSYDASWSYYALRRLASPLMLICLSMMIFSWASFLRETDDMRETMLGSPRGPSCWHRAVMGGTRHSDPRCLSVVLVVVCGVVSGSAIV